MKPISKEFTLLELKFIGDRINYLMSIPMKAGIGYKISQWGKPFISKLQDILNKNNEIILKYCEDKEYSPKGEKLVECQRELNEFFATKDTVYFTKFDITWIEDLMVNDLSILYQFMDDETFEEKSTSN